MMGKMLLWLLVHLAVLALAFYLFVAWQLRLGLDSLLSGTAGDRIRNVGDLVASEIRRAPRSEWPEILERHGKSLGLEISMEAGPGGWIGSGEDRIPENVRRRIESQRRPEIRPPRGPLGPPGAPPFREGPPIRRTPENEAERQDSTPRFLMRGGPSGDYWAGVEIQIFPLRSGKPPFGLLLLRSSDLSGGGLFFDLKPWILGGLAVLAVSLLLWAPFFIRITRYLKRLSEATEAIADGRFEVQVGNPRSDELGALGSSIEAMAARLERLVRGQKRFLGDVAHELCSPLARIRAGLGILEQGLKEEQRPRWESIEEDVEELARLVSELLAFTKATTAPGAVKLESIELEPLLKAALARECPGQSVQLHLPPDLKFQGDRGLMARAIANVLRNARLHAGDSCRLDIAAKEVGEWIELNIADDGPGIGEPDLQRLFEPFYRPDASRSRDSGGAGLGLAIVRAGIEACGGSVRAEPVRPRGLALVFRLRRSSYEESSNSGEGPLSPADAGRRTQAPSVRQPTARMPFEKNLKKPHERS